MKRFLILLIANCCLLTAAFAQTSQTGTDYIARRVQVQLLDAPQKVQNASVFVTGNPGPATYYYWIVTNGAIGASSPAGPFQVINAPNTLTGSNFNQISWNNALGAVSFDVLRTSTPGPPSGACNCAVATTVAGSSTSDQSNTLNAYTVNTFDPSTVVWAITNESVSAGVSQITFRVGGVAKFSLGSSGGAVTLTTPFTAPAHQFFNNFSGGGIFSSAQPASADISDGTGTGVVARATNAALTTPSISSPTVSSPTTTGTDNGVETLGSKTLTSPVINTPSFSALCNNNNTGCKAQRFGATTPTAASAGATSLTAYTWTSAFADANYTVTCTGITQANTPTGPSLESITASGFSARVSTILAAASSYAGLDCIAIHD